MGELFTELTKHPKPIIEILLMYWGFSALVSGMPMPDSTKTNWLASPLYQWAFTSLHTLSGSIKTAVNDPRLQAVIKPEPPKQG